MLKMSRVNCKTMAESLCEFIIGVRYTVNFAFPPEKKLIGI